MNAERPHCIRHKDELYFSLSRVRALQLIWEGKEKVAAAKGLSPISVNDTSQPTDVEWGRLRESVANLWAGFELEALQGSRTDIEVAEGMATILQGYRHEVGFLNEVSARVDELLKEKL